MNNDPAYVPLHEINSPEVMDELMASPAYKAAISSEANPLHLVFPALLCFTLPGADALPIGGPVTGDLRGDEEELARLRELLGIQTDPEQKQ